MECAPNAPAIIIGADAANQVTSALRVAHVVISLDVGGLERLVLDLARQGRRLGQKVSVICLERRGVLAEQVEAAGAQVVCLNKTPGLRPAMVGRIRAVLAELKPDVVHTHQIGALLYAGPAAQRQGVPAVVHTEHINNIAKPTTRFRRARVRVLWWFAARFARRFFCVSDDIAAAAKTYVPEAKVVVIANGIDTTGFDDVSHRERVRTRFDIPTDAPVIGTVGRLNEVKSQDLLIRAFTRVREVHPNAHLLLVGDGPRKEALELLAAELRLADCVHFAGYQAQPQQCLHAMDLFALPSRLEGMPLAILEAWAARLPVVASSVGGVPKLIENGRTGLLFESGDQPALESMLLQLIKDPSFASRLAGAGRAEVEVRYESRRTAMDYQNNYVRLLGR
jgi:glycosyltransferase involved in cell wall biosynthesis